MLYIAGSFTALGALHWDVLEQTKALEGEAAKIEVPFGFTNEGADSVTLVAVKPSCGCTVAAVEQRIFAPGEKGEITAIFTPGQRKGRQSIKIKVTTSDAPQAPTILTLNVELPGEPRNRASVPDVMIHPPSTAPESVTAAPVVILSESSLHWSKGAEPLEKTVTITAPVGVKLLLQPLDQFMSQLLSVRMEEPKEGGGYSLKIKPQEHSGALNQMLVLRVRDANGQLVNRVFVNVIID